MLADPAMPFIPRDPAFDGLRAIWEKHRVPKTAPSGPSRSAKRPCLGCQRLTQSKYQLCPSCLPRQGYCRHEAMARRHEEGGGRGSGHPEAKDGATGRFCETGSVAKRHTGGRS
jgi:hypothetical protein